MEPTASGLSGATPPLPAHSLRLALVGDVGLSSRITEMLRRELPPGSSAGLPPRTPSPLPSDPAQPPLSSRSLPSPRPIPRFAQILHQADLAFANLEVPLLDAANLRAGLKIQGRIEDAPLLAGMGIGIVSLANNHVMDAGPEGLASTRRALASIGIESVGAGETLDEALRPVILERNGIRMGWLAFAEGRASTHHYIARKDRPGAAPLDSGLIEEAVVALRPRVDLVCVSFHQGLNYVHYASPRQREFSRVAAEAGADLIVGHHPHVLQGWERIGSALVLHSLGELLWDPYLGDVVNKQWNEARRRTCVVDLEFKPSGTESMSGQPAREGRSPWTAATPAFHPFRVAEDFRVEPVEGPEREEFDVWMAKIAAVYADYDPKVYLEAADQGVVEHWVKVARFNLRHGNVRYFTGILSRVRGRHLQIGWTHLKRRLGLR